MTLQSLILNTEYVREIMLPRMALLALPSLTHLHSPSVQSDDALQYIAQHLSDRLTFLRLNIKSQYRLSCFRTALRSPFTSTSAQQHAVPRVTARYSHILGNLLQL